MIAILPVSGAGNRRRAGAVPHPPLTGLTTALLVDEATVLHERLDRAVLPWLSPEDFPYLWVVPGLVLALAVVVSVVGLTRAAPAAARRRLLLGFGLLLGSALLLASPVQPWYGLPLVALAALARRPVWAVVPALTYPLFFAVIDTGPSPAVSRVGSACYLAALAVVLLAALRRRRVAPPAVVPPSS